MEEKLEGFFNKHKSVFICCADVMKIGTPEKRYSAWMHSTGIILNRDHTPLIYVCKWVEAFAKQINLTAVVKTAI